MGVSNGLSTTDPAAALAVNVVVVCLAVGGGAGCAAIAAGDGDGAGELVSDLSLNRLIILHHGSRLWWCRKRTDACLQGVFLHVRVPRGGGPFMLSWWLWRSNKFANGDFSTLQRPDGVGGRKLRSASSRDLTEGKSKGVA